MKKKKKIFGVVKRIDALILHVVTHLGMLPSQDLFIIKTALSVYDVPSFSIN